MSKILSFVFLFLFIINPALADELKLLKCEPSETLKYSSGEEIISTPPPVYFYLDDKNKHILNSDKKIIHEVYEYNKNFIKIHRKTIGDDNNIKGNIYIEINRILATLSIKISVYSEKSKTSKTSTLYGNCQLLDQSPKF